MTASSQQTGHPPVNTGWIYRERVTRQFAGLTVLEFYSRRYRHSPEEIWQQRIEQGEILLEGMPAATNTRLKQGQQLEYHRAPWHEPPAPLQFNILLRDAHVLAVAKPAGLPVLPGGNFLQNTLLRLVRDRFGSAVAPVHRLGRGTSGIVLFARTPLARRSLSRDFRENCLTKIYRTLVNGTNMPNEFEITVPIGRIPYPPVGSLFAASQTGRPARTVCRVLFRDFKNKRSLLQVYLITGRPHQIRIHLAYYGYPLVGDPLYGTGGRPQAIENKIRPALPGDVGYFLHAAQVCFLHPVSRRPVTIVSDLPEILKTTKKKHFS